MIRIDYRASLLIGFLLGLLALFFWFSCTAPAATGPAPEAAVVGEWAAAWPDTAEPAGLILMHLGADKAYQVTVEANTTPVERETGTWILRAGRIVFAPASCEAADVVGGILHLITCTGGDSIAVAATGNRLSVSMVMAGALQHLSFERL